jgi:hypothetical protein
LSLNDESGREWFSIVAGIRQASMPGQSTDLNGATRTYSH